MKSNFRVWTIALLGMFVFGITDAYAGGTAYSRARAYLKEGSPTAAGKVYVSTSSSTPAASSYKNCTSSTTAASSAQVEGASKTTTYHFWAKANTGYKFTGWYSKGANDTYTLVSTEAHFSHGVNSGSAPSEGTSYVDYDLYAEFIKLVQLSFIAPTNGSYTITHKGAAVADYASFTVDGTVVLNATPAAGYKLRGWYTTTDGGTTKKYFAFENRIEPKLTENATIGADFVPDDGKAIFWPKGSSSVYYDMNAAFSACGSGGAVVVVSSGALAAGDYTIPANKSLLIPFSSATNVITEPNVVHVTAAGSAPTLAAYRTLSLSTGANVSVNGTICVGGQIASVNGGNASSFPCGTAGVLDLSKGGEITLYSGAILYAWGLVTGQNMDEGNNTTGVGHITAKNGSAVWEDYQVGDFRGGSACLSIYNNREKWRFFPFQTWTIQNIEAPITFERGSTGNCFWTMFADGSIHSVKFKYLANSSSLFTLSASGATMDKWYDPTTDKVCYQLGGSTTLDAMSLTVSGTTITTNDYNLPVPCNISIILKSGTFTVSKPIVMHAGANMEVKSGATFSVNTNVYMFDKDEWDKFCMYYSGSNVYFQKFNTITKHYDRGDRTSKAKLTDASMLVNGTLSVTSSGKLYSTAGGCQITGDNGGVVQYASSLPAASTVIMCTTLKDTKSVSIANVNMLNENGTYTKSIGSSTFDNVNGRWFVRSAKNPKAEDHTWDFTYIKSGANTGTGGTNAIVSAVYSHDKTGAYDRMKWFNVTPDECEDWWKDASSYLYNWTLNSAWHQFIPTETPNVYSGSDNVMHQKGDDCTWDAPDYPREGCFYIVDETPKAFVNGELIALTANSPDDHAWHKTSDASKYYICLADCNWRAATRIAGKQQAYTTTIDSKNYIWYSGAWVEVTWDGDISMYYSVSGTGTRIYYDFVGSAWTLAPYVAEVVTSSGTEKVFAMATAMSRANAATTDVTIRLLKDVTINSAISYTGTHICTMDLNGCTLTGTVTSMLRVNNASATLVVKDQSAAGTGKVYARFSRSDNFVYGINVTAGHFILNSGTVHIENIHASQGAVGVHLYDTYKFTMNGGKVEAVSNGESRGVNTQSSTTTKVIINGGTIESYTASSSAVAYGIYSTGSTITINGGTIYTHSTSSDGGTKGVHLNSGTSNLTINGGTINSEAKTKAYGVFVASDASASTTVVNAGIITGSTTSTVKAYGMDVYGTTTINGGKIKAIAKTEEAYGVINRGSKMVINSSDTIYAEAKTYNAATIYTTNAASAKAWVNAGVFVAKAPYNSYGFYAFNGTDTINGGEFLVTATGTNKNAYGIYLAATNPKVVVNGGKFKVTASGDSYKHINTIASGGTATQLSLAGGYYSKAPHASAELGSGSCIAAGKDVYDVERAKEQAIYDAGYVKKIRGNEYTITFKHSKTSATLETKQIESGKIPTYTGAAIGDYAASESDDTYEFIGWSTTQDGSPAAIPAVGSANVTYWAVFSKVLAEVTIGTTTTRYYESDGVSAAWSAALGASTGQATIKVMSNAGNLAQLAVFNPTQANAIITLDLNGRHWGMDGTVDTPSGNNWFIKINKSNSKLIITDNTEDGEGYIQTSWAKAATLSCVLVNTGELVLERGAIKCNNTHATNNAIGVNVYNGTFTMLGGTIEAKKQGASVTGGIVYGISSDGNVELSAGKIIATNGATSGGEVRAIQASKQNKKTYAGEDFQIEANGNTAAAFFGTGNFDINGGTYKVTSKSSNARGIRAYQNDTNGDTARVHISGNPHFLVKSESSNSYGVVIDVVSSNPNGVTVEIDSATFDIKNSTAGTAYGIYNAYGTMIVHKAKIDILTHGSGYVLYVNRGSSTSIESGSYKLLTDTTASIRNNVDIIRNMGFGAEIDITGGSFEVKNNGTSDGTSYILKTNGGSTSISGTPTFKSSYRGIFAIYDNSANDDSKAEVIIDGGDFESYQYVLQSNTSTNANTTRGDITILDGKFKVTKSMIRSDGTNTPTTNLHIKGGYYSATTASTYVESPSEGITLKSGDAYYPEYEYHVICRHAITWNDGTSDITTDNVLHNEMPDYGEIDFEYDGTDTYEFVAWNTEPDGSGDTVTIAKEDVTYYAQWRKLEAEVIEGEDVKRFESFENAFAYAKNLPIATVKVLSDVALTKAIVQDSLATLTIDLNGHTLSRADTAIVMDNEDVMLTITDSRTGGKIAVSTSKAATLYAAVVKNGELRLAGGELSVQNSAASQAAYAVEAKAGATFSMTDGTLEANAKTNAVAINAGGAGCAFNISGGTVNVSTEAPTDTWGNYAYGIKLDGNGTASVSGNPTFNVDAGQYAYGVYTNGSGISATVGGTAAFNVTAHTYDGSNNSRAYGFYVATSSTINVNGGTYTVRVPDSKKECYGAYVLGTINIAGGTFDVRATDDKGDNIDVIRAAAAASIVNITGGTFNSCQNGMRAMGGTTTISGNPTFNNANICVAAAYYSGINGTANVTIYGGTFTTTNNYPLYPAWRKSGSNIANSNIVVYGGYFKGKGSYVAYKYVDGDGTASLTLYGGYFAGQKIRYDTSPSASDHNWNEDGYNCLGSGTAATSVPNPSAEYTAGYRYKLTTPYTITWSYGGTSVDSTVMHGFVPYKNDITTYTSDGKIYYFTGWTPTPVAATGNATYTATGVAYEASVTVDETTTYYADFADAWEYALDQSEATITLLNDVTSDKQLTYRPVAESARHTLDLNNYSLAYNGDNNAFLLVNRDGAQLTITDNSVGGNGKLKNEVAYDGTSQTVMVSYGELVLAGGEISVLNTRSGKSGYAVTVRARGAFTMTDGTVKAVAKTGARAINTNGTTSVDISGGLIIANTYISSSYGADAYGIVSYGNSTINLSGYANFTIDASTNAVGLMMSGSGVTATVDDGLFNVKARTTTSAQGIHAQDNSTVTVNYCEIHADANTINANAVYAKSNATITVKDGEFEAYVRATGTGSKGVSATHASGGTVNIEGGEFSVDVVDHQGDNVNVARVDNDSYMNISGGTFNMNASSATQSGNGIRAFGGTTTISGTPTFNAINGVYVGGWAIGDGGAYTAYTTINGGTFDVSRYAIYASISEHDGKYASADVTVNGGFFKTSGTKVINKGANGASTTVSLALKGGYYSNNSVNGTPSTIDGYASAPYYARATTSAEKSAVGTAYNYRVAERYTLTWDLDGGSIASAGTAAGYVEVGATVTAPTVTKTGYTFAGWTPAFTGTMPAANTTYTATWTPNTNTAYTVKHYKQNLAGDGYDLADTDNLTGTTGASVTPAVKSYTGFTAPSTQTVTILADGSRVVTYNYTRNKYTVTVATSPVGYGSVSATSITSVPYGTAVSTSSNTLTISGKTPVTASAADATAQYTYAFSSWSGVPATVTGNVTITANFTRTVNNYTVTWKNGDITLTTTSVAYGSTPSYGGVTPTKAADATYVYTFDGWSATDGGAKVSPLPTVTGAITYYAHYSTASSVASVTISGETTTYYATIKLALDFAKTQANPEITLLEDATLPEPYELTPTVAGWHGTLDLNNFTLTGTTTTDRFFTKQGADAVFTITDNSDDKGGTLNLSGNYNGALSGIVVNAGELILAGGTIHAENTYSGKSANGINVNGTGSNAKFTQTGGKIEVTSLTAPVGVTMLGTAVVSGGEIEVTTTGSDAKAFKMDYASSVLTISGGTFDVSGASSSFGIYQNASGATATISGSPAFDVRTTGATAYGIRTSGSGSTVVIGGTPTISATAGTTTTSCVIAASSGHATINGGTFNGYAAGDAPYVVYANSGRVDITGGEFMLRTNTGTSNIDITRVDHNSTLNISGGTFSTYADYTKGSAIRAFGGTITISGTPTFAAYQGVVAADYLGAAASENREATVTINGGTFDVRNYAIQASWSKNSSDYYLTSDITVNGGKFKTSGGVLIYKKADDAASSSLAVNGGYFSKNTTNLASYVTANHTLVALTAAEKAVIGSDYNWQVSDEYGVSGKLDIVDYSPTEITLNMNGYVSTASQAGWKVKAYGNTYDKSNRAADRTLVVDISSASLSADDTIRIDGTASDGTTVESHYLYIMPHIFTSNTTLDPASVKATSILYVKSGTLTIDANVRVNKVYVCADAMLVIDKDATLTVDSLFLRTKPFHAAELENNGTLTATKVYYTRQIADKSTYYEIALPFNVTLANVRFSNGKKATYGTHYGLMKYDGQSRANNGPNTSLNWQTLNPASVTTMNGTQAYEMISASAYYYEFYFPVTYSKPVGTPSVDVTAYARAEGTTPKGDKGWNYLTSPYTHSFECNYTNPEDGIKIAWRDEEDQSVFNQDVATVIKPTQAFFYQTEATKSLVFDTDNFQLAAMPHRAAQSLSTQWIRLHYGAAAEGASTDVANIYLNDEKFTSAYETGYDVAKWSLDGGKPLVWTVVGNDKLAFAALPDSAAENMIPVTVFNPTEGAFTFSLEPNRYMKRLEHVYLWDASMNTTVDLLDQAYTDFIGAGTIEGRFFLYTRKTPTVVTDIDLTGDGIEANTARPRKVIIDDKVYILRGERIYSIDGQVVKY